MATSLSANRNAKNSRSQEVRDYLTNKVDVLRDFRVITPRNERDIVNTLYNCTSEAQLDRVCRGLLHDAMFADQTM